MSLPHLKLFRFSLIDSVGPEILARRFEGSADQGGDSKDSCNRIAGIESILNFPDSAGLNWAGCGEANAPPFRGWEETVLVVLKDLDAV